MGDVMEIGSIIAIDDISIDLGECKDLSKDRFQCSVNQTIPKSYVCDGDWDCA